MSAYVELIPRLIGSSAVMVSREKETSVKGSLSPLVISISDSCDVSIETVLLRI